MKKIALLLVAVMLIMMLVSCDVINGFINPDEGSGEQGGTGTPGGDTTDPGTDTPGGDETPDTPENPENPGTENPENPGTDEPEQPEEPEELGKEPLPSSAISVTALRGLNEQIYLSITPEDGFTYRVGYKLSAEKEYTTLDENLIVETDGKLECYILGIVAGNYDIKIEAESETAIATKSYTEISVSAQDRSGYAHFGSTEGVGAYNSDGTVKDGTKIIYVTNENKNTVNLTIDGTEYVGLVNILQAQYRSDTPLLVRVIGKITTNQWSYKNDEPRLSDGSNTTDDFFINTFSTEYGENLANLIVKMKFNGGINGGGQTYNYRTTAEGLTDVRITNGGTKYTSYKGSDFPTFSGKSVFDDDSYYNMLEVKGSENITIEGIGTDAELFQFGIGFEECNSIEIKNLTFTDYPEDALNFLGGDRADLANYARYWIHSCTFNRGYNAWDISGERDKFAGDGSVDFNNVSNVTVSYNEFNNPKKTMLFGSGDSEACMNFTMHHNYFYKVDSRLPLGRNVNIHSYNNLFDQCKNCSDIRKNSYLFSENNYFNSSTKPFIPSSSAIKSYGDVFAGSSKNGATIVSDRTQVVSINCKPDNSTNYSAFDLNSQLFYYDEVNQQSDVQVMHSALYVLQYVPTCAGAGYMGVIEME